MRLNEGLDSSLAESQRWDKTHANAQIKPLRSQAVTEKADRQAIQSYP